jgi:hypothetical protein
MKFYICLTCGELTTSQEIKDHMFFGGSGYCYCQYCQLQWDEQYKSFEPVYFRHFTDWTEISETIYDSLKAEENTIKRLWMYRTVPASRRIINDI